MTEQEKREELLKKLRPEGIALLMKFQNQQVQYTPYDSELGKTKVKRLKEIQSRQFWLKTNSIEVQEWITLLKEESSLFSSSWEVRKFVNTGSEDFKENDEWRPK